MLVFKSPPPPPPKKNYVIHKLQLVSGIYKHQTTEITNKLDLFIWK